MYSREWVYFAVIIVCFIAGYSIISFLYNKINKYKNTGSENSQCDPSGKMKSDYENGINGDSSSSTNQGKGGRNKYQSYAQKKTVPTNETGEPYSEEQRYANVLGLKQIFTTEDIKKAFRELISKYHPDKINHLGEEFKKISEVKTRDIMEAYNYFRNKYNIR